jgi:diguanylate cyclase (GGDEF)-like protein/PAS domain S-box-containing protein
MSSKPYKKLRSIYASLLLVVIGGLVIPALVGGYWLIGIREQNSARAEFDASLPHYADLLAIGIKEPLWTLNADASRALVESVMRDQAVFRIRVSDQAGTELINVQSKRPQSGKISAIERVIAVRGKTIGRIAIEMDDGKYIQELRDKQRAYIFVLAAQLIISLLLIILFLNARLITPLRKLTGFSDRLSHGDFDAELQLSHRDELGRLAGHFRFMRDSIRHLFADVGQREERFRTIVTQMPGAVFRLMPDGRVEFVNNMIESISGYPATSFTEGGALKWSDLIVEADLPRVREQVLTSIHECKAYEVEYWIVAADGSERGISESGKPQASSEGNKAHWIDGIIVDISERKRNEMRIQALLTEQQAILDNVMFGVMFVRQRTIVSVNRCCEALFGYTAGEMIGQSTAIIYPSPEAFELAGVRHYPAIDKGDNVRSELQYLKKDGTLFWCLISGSWLEHDRPHEGSVWVFADISERKQSEEKLRLAEKVFDNITDGVVVADSSGIILAVNPAFTRITGYGEPEALGKTPKILMSGSQDASFYKDIWSELLTTDFYHGEVWNCRKNGERYLESLTISTVRDQAGQPTHFVGVFSDTTLIKQSQERLKHQAHHDALTGLPNRMLFNDRLKHALQRNGRENLHVAVLFIDLDRFKNVNDTLGHQVGDELLKQVSSALSASVREGDTLARLGGDEFILLLEKVDGQHGAAVVAEKLLAVLEQPFIIAGHELFITCSIGISLFPQDGDDLHLLIRNADVAMYQAKGRGRNSYRFYEQEMAEEGVQRLRMENLLRRSLDHGEIFLNYQPQVDIETGNLTGVEALVRWQHPELGLVSPISFIPIAEECGYISQLGKWVLDEACRQMIRWQQGGLHVPKIAVNLSVKQFERGSIVSMVADILAETGLEPQRLQLEVTESLIMNTGDAFRFINDLYSIGVGLAIDDFGTGYSSLAYLRQLPVQTLKIDRSFIKDIPADPNDEAIAIAIIQLGKSLNLSVIAEGVETKEQAAFLLMHGCHHAQGYFYGRPVLPQELAERWGAPALLTS